MKHRGLLITGLVLLAVGATGLALGSCVREPLPSSAPPATQVPAGTFSSLGQQIYYTGTDQNGPIPRSAQGGRGMMERGMMGGLACVDCHGQDGRGGRTFQMYGGVVSPDIRYSALTSTRTIDGTTEPAWTEAQIERAVTAGVDPSGEPLQAPMPRWDMTPQDLSAVIAYLKEL